MTNTKRKPNRRIDPVRNISECPTMGEHVRRLRAMSRVELLEEYRRLHGKEPRLKVHGWLWKRCAIRIQTTLLGGLSGKAKARLDGLIDQLGIDFSNPTATPRVRTPAAEGPAVGTTLVRDYKGERIEVRVHADGFEWDGQLFPSLSAVAKAITGSHCSGRAFFRLTKRRAKA